MKKLNILYRQNPAYTKGGDREPKLFATLKLRDFGLGDEVRQLPIYYRKLDGDKEVYASCISGLGLEQPSLPDLELALEIRLAALIHFGRLPEYVFRIQDRAWPIYRLDDYLVSRSPGSAIYCAPTIAELRLELAAHFKMFAQISVNKEIDILHLSRFDMQLYSPLFVLRAPDMADIPVFCIDDDTGGGELVAPVGVHSITEPLDDGMGILKMHDSVAAYLMAAGRLSAPAAMSIRKLTAHNWQFLSKKLQPLGEAFIYAEGQDQEAAPKILPLYTTAQRYISARTNRLARTALRLAPDIDGLRQSLAQELVEAGKLASPDFLALSTAQPVASD